MKNYPAKALAGLSTKGTLSSRSCKSSVSILEGSFLRVGPDNSSPLQEMHHSTTLNVIVSPRSFSLLCFQSGFQRDKPQLNPGPHLPLI